MQFTPHFLAIDNYHLNSQTSISSSTIHFALLPSLQPRPRNLTHELPKIPLRRLLNRILQRTPILRPELPLHPRQMCPIPMHSHQPGDQQLVSQFVVFVFLEDVFDCVVEQKSVAGGFVDYPVEDVGYHLALGWVSGVLKGRGVRGKAYDEVVGFLESSAGEVLSVHLLVGAEDFAEMGVRTTDDDFQHGGFATSVGAHALV